MYCRRVLVEQKLTNVSGANLREPIVYNTALEQRWNMDTQLSARGEYPFSIHVQ